jgi:hypothetical protein
VTGLGGACAGKGLKQSWQDRVGQPKVHRIEQRRGQNEQHGSWGALHRVLHGQDLEFVDTGQTAGRFHAPSRVRREHFQTENVRFTPFFASRETFRATSMAIPDGQAKEPSQCAIDLVLGVDERQNPLAIRGGKLQRRQRSCKFPGA